MPSEHRLHPSSILFALAGSLKAFALPAVLVLLTSGRTSPQPAAGRGWGPAGWMNRWMPGDFEIANWQFWILLFLVPATIVAITRYFSFRLHYEGTELVIRSGIFFRNERHVPYARIQNLDAVRNVVHRLLGVTEVRVETVVPAERASEVVRHGGRLIYATCSSEPEENDHVVDAFLRQTPAFVLLDAHGVHRSLAADVIDQGITMTGGGQMILVGVSMTSLPAGWIFEP